MAVPPDPTGMDSEAEDEMDDADEDQNKDFRYTLRQREKMIADEDGYISDSEDEDEQLRRPTRHNRADYRESHSSLTEGRALIKDFEEDSEEDAEENAEEGTENDMEEDIEEDPEDIEKEIEENAGDDDIENSKEDTTELEIEVEVLTAVGNSAEISDSESEGEVGDEEPAEQATPPSLAAYESAQFTPARSDTSELQGDTVMVEVPPTFDDITT